MGPRRNARGAVVPPGVSPGDPLVPFPSLGKGPAPQGGTPFAIPRLGHGKEDPSSVTACAVTPSPQRGKALGKTARRPTGAPGSAGGRALQKTVVFEGGIRMKKFKPTKFDVMVLGLTALFLLVTGLYLSLIHI